MTTDERAAWLDGLWRNPRQRIGYREHIIDIAEGLCFCIVEEAGAFYAEYGDTHHRYDTREAALVSTLEFQRQHYSDEINRLQFCIERIAAVLDEPADAGGTGEART